MIRGVISDSATGEIIEQASVSLIRAADSVTLQRALSRKEGFEFQSIPINKYFLRISFTGYRTEIVPLALSITDSVYNTGKIKMVKSASDLMEVVVKSIIPPVIVKNDTLVYNTNTVKTQPNATIEDLIKKLPGMEVDKDGNITLQGQKVEKIYVDGKEFFLNDPRLATQNLTADMVDAIEAFDNQSDQAKFTRIKETNNTKAINIRLKKDKRKGLSGNAMFSAGNKKTYMANATATYFNGDRWAFGRIGGNYADNLLAKTGLKQSNNNEILNYRDNIGAKTQIVLNYASNDSRNESGQTYKRETFLGDSSLLQTRNSFNDNRSVNHTITVNLTYNADSLTSIVYNPSISWQHNETIDSSNSFILSEKDLTSYLSNEGKTMNHVSSTNYNLNNTITYRRRFNKQGRSFYGNFSQSHQQQNGNGNLYSAIKFYDNRGGPIENQIINQYYQQKNNSNNYSLNISFVEPIKANQLIDFGYSLSTFSNISGKLAYNYDSTSHEYDLPDTLITNQFINSNTQQNFRAGYNYIGKKVQYQLGMNVLYSSLKNESDNHNYSTIEQSLVNWSPRASAFYSLGLRKNLRVQYNGSSATPTSEMLQPVPDMSNPFLVKLGNPNLKQQFQHSLEFGYNSSNGKTFSNLSFQIRSNLTVNKIVQSSTISATGIQELKFVNINGTYSFNSDVNYGFALNKTKNGGGSISSFIQYSRDINLVNGEQNVRQGFVWRPRFNLNYHSKDWLYTGLSAGLSYSHSHYSIGTTLNTELLSQNYAANTTCLLPFGMRLSSDITIQANGKQADLPGITIITWNASLFKNIFRNNKGEIRISGFDLLNRNTGFSQTTGDNYIETRESPVLQRYFLLSLRYNFRADIL